MSAEHSYIADSVQRSLNLTKQRFTFEDRLKIVQNYYETSYSIKKPVRRSQAFKISHAYPYYYKNLSFVQLKVSLE